MMNNKKLIKTQQYILQTLKTATYKKVVIGISGGLDSAITLKLMIDWLGKNNVLAYYLPIENINNTSNYIKDLEGSFGIKIYTCDLTKLWKKQCKLFGLKKDLSRINLKSKIRAVFLSSLAQDNEALLVSCLNYDEYYLGYFTKTGDGIGDVFPLINFCKKELYQLANELMIPINIINRLPSADLYPNQVDEDELQLKYSDIDNYLLNTKKLPKTIINKIEKLHKSNSHKHNLTPNLFSDNGLRKD